MPFARCHACHRFRRGEKRERKLRKFGCQLLNILGRIFSHLSCSVGFFPPSVLSFFSLFPSLFNGEIQVCEFDLSASPQCSMFLSSTTQVTAAAGIQEVYFASKQGKGQIQGFHQVRCITETCQHGSTVSQQKTETESNREQKSQCP